MTSTDAPTPPERAALIAEVLDQIEYFECPECEGHYFGTDSGPPEELHCHDEYQQGCTWHGPRADGESDAYKALRQLEAQLRADAERIAALEEYAILAAMLLVELGYADDPRLGELGLTAADVSRVLARGDSVFPAAPVPRALSSDEATKVVAAYRRAKGAPDA